MFGCDDQCASWSRLSTLCRWLLERGAHLLLMEGLGNHVPGDSQLVAGIACQYLSVDIAYYMITCYNT